MLSQTVQVLINQAAPIIVATVTAFLVKEIALVGDAAIGFIRKKEESVAVKVGIDKYNSNLEVAKKVWGQVDEYFRITPTVQKTIETAQNKFAEEIVKVIPGITTDEIEHLRQAVAGEINKGKEAITAPVEVEPTAVTVKPVLKYVAPDGTELQPVTSITTANNTVQ